MSTIGKVLKSKAGTHYIKLGQDRDATGKLFGKNAKELFPITLGDGSVLNEGDVLFLKTIDSEIKGLVDKGFITPEQGEARLAKVPEFVKYKVQVGEISRG